MTRKVQIRTVPGDSDIVRLRLPNGFLFKCRNEWLLPLADAVVDWIEYGATQPTTVHQTQTETSESNS